ncbi:MAG: adenine deaminase [Candidatus Aureabacteria bacterium]|nr:adenine deaminase [Candidatus Auribacterota bacterium]
MERLDRMIRVARGKAKADVVLRNGRVVNVYTGECVETDVAILGDRIVGLGSYRGAKEYDVAGRFVAPGFIDAHIHLESAMVTVPEFARVVVPMGTTSVVSDPHEIANVMGLEGINYMIRSSKYNPLNVFVMVPSCVPSSPLETPGAVLRATDILFFLNQEWVLGLAEMMDYPGLLACDPAILDKVRIAGRRIIDGHAPGLSGKDLCAYIAAGISSDHECVTEEEAREKLRLGMTVMIREGGCARNMEALLPLVTPATAPHCAFCTDDRHPQALISEGHMNGVLRKAVRLGLDPVTAITLCTLNPARHYGLDGLGAVAPGKIADIVVLEDLDGFSVEMVFKNGRLAAQDGALIPGVPGAPRPPEPLRGSINIQWLAREQFEIPASRGRLRAIALVPGQLLTRLELVKPSVLSGRVVADPGRDLLKIAVIERHHASPNIGLGIVRGFGLTRGAIASSVAHDSHNIVAVGTNDADILEAVIKIRKLQGGLTAVVDGKLIASVALPIAGLMSEKSVREVGDELDALIAAARRMGCRLEDPFMMLSFLSLSVIPELKLTDKGLVDVSAQKIVPLFAQERAGGKGARR